MNSNNWLKDFEKWSQEILDKKENERKKNQYRERGKLGGRPKKYHNKKSKKILLSLTPIQKEILDKVSESYGIKPQELIRHLILNTTPKDAERNKILIEFRTNFRRISNHFKSNVWTNAEKEKYKSEINKIISLIENELKNDR